MAEYRYTWTSTGKTDVPRRRIVHTSFRRRNVTDGSTREFKLGNFVTVDTDDDGPRWCAHLVGLFTPLGASACTDSMRCTLRWLYTVSDLEDGLAGGPGPLANPRIPSPVQGEVFFSDHVEEAGSNSVDVIAGRVVLCTTPLNFFSTRSNRPKSFERGDAIRLLRCFYGSSRNPKPLRLLERGELRLLQESPSEDAHLFEGVHLAQLTGRAEGAGGHRTRASAKAAASRRELRQREVVREREAAEGEAGFDWEDDADSEEEGGREARGRRTARKSTGARSPGAPPRRPADLPQARRR